MAAQRQAIGNKFKGQLSINNVTEQDLQNRVGKVNPEAVDNTGEVDEDDFEDEASNLLASICGIDPQASAKGKAGAKGKAQAKGKAVATPSLSSKPRVGTASASSSSRPATSIIPHAAAAAAAVAPSPSPQKAAGRKTKSNLFAFDPQAYLDADGMDALHLSVSELNTLLKQDWHCSRVKNC
jgi:hypothetical protein